MKDISIEELDFKKMGGIMPAVIQDANTQEVLTVVFVNEEALRLTMRTGFVHRWSRTSQRIIMKGETSGNTQRVKRILTDCDVDSVIFLVEPKGPACHTGERTCFHKEMKGFVG
ncbi:MAG: phosphoribosyl-AMP cyclohydrolase [archaeon]